MKYEISYPDKKEIDWMNEWADKYFGEADKTMVEPTL